MPAQPERQQVRRPPVGRALLVLLVTGVLTGGACWGAVLSAPSGMQPLIGWGGGGAGGVPRSRRGPWGEKEDIRGAPHHKKKKKTKAEHDW